MSAATLRSSLLDDAIAHVHWVHVILYGGPGTDVVILSMIVSIAVYV